MFFFYCNCWYFFWKITIYTYLCPELCHGKEWVNSYCGIYFGFSAWSHGWWHTLVHSPGNEEHKYLSIPNWKAKSSASWHYYLCSSHGYTRWVKLNWAIPVFTLSIMLLYFYSKVFPSPGSCMLQYLFHLN